ncbi:right-handed parallel beta-helix repeat-containing protein [bacterium]|nr:right-handed parallel beta-helix repeat-containing protein [bacterium]
MKRTLFPCILILLLMVFPVLAETIVVDQINGPIYAIREGVNEANPTDTVLVMPGTYFERVDISQEMVILGYDRYSTRVSNGDICFRILAGAGNARIQNFSITGGGTGVDMDNRNANVSIIGCIIHNCNYGIFSDEDVFIAENNVFRYNTQAIRLFSWWANGQIRNNIFHDNDKGITFIYDDMAPVILNNIFYDNNDALYESNCDVVGNIAYNIFYLNNRNIYGDVAMGPDNQYQNPFFDDLAEFNYYLLAISTGINAGEIGELREDPNGTRNDIGVFGGPNAWGGIGPGVISITIDPPSVPQGETFNLEATGTVH